MPVVFLDNGDIIGRYHFLSVGNVFSLGDIKKKRAVLYMKKLPSRKQNLGEGGVLGRGGLISGFCPDP
jgi:hypothetical protein